MRKIAVLGLDGLSKEILLANIKYTTILRKSLDSKKLIVKNMDCLPPLTFPSWTNILTGVNPGKHNVFDFFKYEIILGNGWRAKLVTTMDLMHPRIHETLSLLNSSIRVSLINQVPPYPLIPVSNAELIQLEFFTPKTLYYPKHIGKKYKEEIDLVEKLQFHKVEGCKAIDKAVELLDIYGSIIEKALERRPDLLWVTTPIPDSILHKCHIAAKRPEMLRKVFMEIDKVFARLIDEFDYVFLVSDHGFKYYEKRIAINRILYEEGLVVKTRFKSDFKEEGYLGETEKGIYVSGRLYKILKTEPIRQLARLAYRILRKIGYHRPVIYETGIDFNNSKAFIPADKSTAPPRFYLIIKDKDIDSTELVKNLKIIFKKYGLDIAMPNEVFNGPYTRNAPGPLIILEPESEVWIIPGTIYVDKIIRRGIANHSRYGILGVFGIDDYIIRSIEEMQEPLPNTIPTPLILGLLGSPISDQTDHIGLVRRVIPNIKTASVVRKWLLYKKIIELKARRISSRSNNP